MSLEWDEVLARVLRLVESTYVASLARVCVVRDLSGKVRLALEKRLGAGELSPTAFHDAVTSELGAWFAGPALWTDGPTPDASRLARQLLDRHPVRRPKQVPQADIVEWEGAWPDGWPVEWDDGTGSRRPISDALWSGEERVRAKQSWLSYTTGRPAWPLHEKTPAVVSFYSFKGGVGRTTTLAAVARSMAKEGRKVAVVDLDLEAPGAGRLLDVQTERGVLDLLVEHIATGGIDAADLDRHMSIVSFQGGGGEVVVFPVVAVGPLTWSYVEKLGRLDFMPHFGRQDGSPVEEALKEILRSIKRIHAPDYIFLDARAGLHDLGGLSLHALSHLDVLVGRAGSAALDGLSLAIDAIRRRRRPEDQRVLVVQTFVPLPTTSGESVAAQELWRAGLWDCFLPLDTVGGAERPGVDDPTARHYPWPVPAFDSIARADRIQDIDPATLDAEPFVLIRDRIHELCRRRPLEAAAEEEEEEGDV
jgi:hypothetical protein